MTTQGNQPLLSDLRQIRAIIRREVRSRYTGDKLGYWWAYIFPLSWMLVIYVAFVVLGRNSPVDTDIVSFLLSGVMPYLAARFAINAILRVRAAYRYILILPQINIEKVAAYVFLLELANSIATFSILLVANFVAFGYLELHDPILALWGLTLAVGSGASFAFFLTVSSQTFPALSKSAPIILRPLFYISGVFYIANEIPPNILKWISWNPLFHAIEILREGMFIGYVSVLSNSIVPISFIAACLTLSIVISSFVKNPLKSFRGEEVA